MENSKNIEVNNNYGVVAENIDNVTVNLPINKIKHSILALFLEELIENNAFEKNYNKKYVPYNINDKLNYNNIIKYKNIIEKYSVYYSICDDTLNQIDNAKIGSKNKILTSINDKYMTIRGEYLKKANQDNVNIMNVIKDASDSIMDEIVKYYLAFIMNIENMDEYDYEDLEINLIAFITYCFMECKILEKPKLKEEK